MIRRAQEQQPIVEKIENRQLTSFDQIERMNQTRLLKRIIEAWNDRRKKEGRRRKNMGVEYKGK